MLVVFFYALENFINFFSKKQGGQKRLQISIWWARDKRQQKSCSKEEFKWNINWKSMLQMNLLKKA